jgi:hypothetical protein
MGTTVQAKYSYLDGTSARVSRRVLLKRTFAYILSISGALYYAAITSWYRLIHFSHTHLLFSCPGIHDRSYDDIHREYILRTCFILPLTDLLVTSVVSADSRFQVRFPRGIAEAFG